MDMFVAIGLGGLLGGRTVTSLLTRMELTFAQKRRDGRAAKLHWSKTEPFVLYLRPFSVTDRLSLIGISTKWGGMDIESLIANSCRSCGELLALGQPGESIGAGRISSPDHSWKDSFVRLAERARAIVVIPAKNAGTLFEIEYIKINGLLGKTMFLMPPRTVKTFSELSFEGSNERDYAENWAHVREVLLELGINVPPYSQSGAVIEFIDDGAHYSQTPFGPGVASIKQVLNSHLAACKFRCDDTELSRRNGLTQGGPTP
jgi:hypothetical protein